MEDKKPQVHDPMEEVNLDTVEEPRINYISYLFSTNLKEWIISLLQEFKDCFALNYDEMPRLDRSLVEHLVFPLGINSILSNNHLEECPRK